jgi:NAD(P)-dependent dehydrogenase (short-subunit alcohol dehydrogenase family)
MGALDGKVVLVTGAARGIGEAVAERCAAQGASVGVLDIDSDGARRVASDIAEAGGRALPIEASVADPEAVAAAVAVVVGEYGGLTGLVNNAGVLYEADTVATTLEQWEHTLDVNLKGPWLCARAAIPAMLEAGGGSIVNIASIEAHSVRADHAAYVAAKGGLIALTKGIAIEYGRRGIRCNSISPGSIATGMFYEYVAQAPDPEALQESLIAMNYRGRLGTPQEIADAAVFLLSDASGFTNAADLVIDGGRLSAT